MILPLYLPESGGLRSAAPGQQVSQSSRTEGMLPVVAHGPQVPAVSGERLTEVELPSKPNIPPKWLAQILRVVVITTDRSSEPRRKGGER